MATIHVCDICGEKAAKLTALVVSIAPLAASTPMEDIRRTFEAMQQQRLQTPLVVQWVFRTREFCDRDSCRVKALGEAWESAYKQWHDSTKSV